MRSRTVTRIVFTIGVFAGLLHKLPPQATTELDDPDPAGPPGTLAWASESEALPTELDPSSDDPAPRRPEQDDSGTRPFEPCEGFWLARLSLPADRALKPASTPVGSDAMLRLDGHDGPRGATAGQRLHGPIAPDRIPLQRRVLSSVVRPHAPPC